MNARLTAYADAREHITDLVDFVDRSPLTRDVTEIREFFDPNVRASAAGNATQELLVTYESTHSIYDAFISRGFVPDDEVRAYDGHEYWTVIVTGDRRAIQTRLDEIRTEMRATIAVEETTSLRSETCETPSKSTLSERQREVLELAQRRGYYS